MLFVKSYYSKGDTSFFITQSSDIMDGQAEKIIRLTG
jgi:hypothetical protein